MNEIQVGLGDRAYPILIEEGLLGRIGADLKKRVAARRFAVIADSNVAAILGQELMVSIDRAGLSAELIEFPAGEASKNLNTVAELASKLARSGFDRNDALIALGGGVTGDITGFLAAIYMRGIPFLQVPTTLLAQVDSSVGGKTGVDIPEGKNLVGSFYQPKCVYIDSRMLISLPAPELLNGLAEVIKYSVIQDRDFFEFLTGNRQSILSLDLTVLAAVIRRCCLIKAQVVAADEKESDLRRILNFGHTIGHAVEAASGFSLAHGSAVAMGMVAAGQLAVYKSLFPQSELKRLSDLIEAFGLPTEIPDEIDQGRIKEYLKTDKKAVAGRLFFVLPTAIGKVIITELSDEVSEHYIDLVI